MSHFPVAVFTNHYPTQAEIEHALAPYDANTSNPSYLAYEPLRSADFLRSRWEESGKPCTFSFYAEDEGYHYDPESDTIGYILNPNAFFDYWTLGGAFSQSLCKKRSPDEPPVFADFARLCDVDFTHEPIIPFAFVDLNRIWCESYLDYHFYIAGHCEDPNVYIAIVDCHA